MTLEGAWSTERRMAELLNHRTMVVHLSLSARRRIRRRVLFFNSLGQLLRAQIRYRDDHGAEIARVVEVPREDLLGFRFALKVDHNAIAHARRRDEISLIGFNRQFLDELRGPWTILRLVLKFDFVPHRKWRLPRCAI